MSKWTGVALFDATKLFEVEADSADEAFEAAYEKVGYASLCHQCASELDLGDCIGVLAYDEDGNEHTDEWRALQAKKVETERDALSAECERLRAQVAERDAEIEEWSGTAVQNGMEVDRLTARLAELEAPAQAEGLEVVAFMMRPDFYSPYVSITRDTYCTGAVDQLVRLSDAQRLIDGLRSQLHLAGVAHDMTMHTVTGEHVTDLMAVKLERDELRAQLAQRTEAERELRNKLEHAQRHERHRNNAETRYWCDQYKQLARAAINATQEGESHAE